MGYHAVQTPLQLPDVLLHSLGDQLDDAFTDLNPHLSCLGGQDRHAGLQVRGLNINDQPPLEPGAQPVLQQGQGLGRPVGSNNHLITRVMQVVEGVKKAFVGLFLAAHELHVVH